LQTNATRRARQAGFPRRPFGRFDLEPPGPEAPKRSSGGCFGQEFIDRTDQLYRRFKRSSSFDFFPTPWKHIVEIIYLNRKNHITQRKVQLHSIRDGRAKVFCLERQAPRILLIENILAVQPVVGRAI
jgi:hypothetical protein